MKKILLACNAGMSTSLLVTRMEKVAKDMGIEVEILAIPVLEAEKMLNDWDIVLLGPQVRHLLKHLENKSQGTPIRLIDMRDYGTMNGKNVLEAALKEIE